MTNEKTKVVYRGMPFTTILFVVFLVLKLTKTIDWSWWWVTSPLWLSAAIAIGILAFAFLIGIIATIIGAIFKS